MKLRLALPFVLSLTATGLLIACGGGGGGADSGAARVPAVDVTSVHQDSGAGGGIEVPLYRVYERSVTNSRAYANKFTDVVLRAQYTAPSGRQVNFYGFYDGDGSGAQDGNVWKMRFMPDETGAWSYAYSWSDGTPGGTGGFNAVADGAGRGVLRAYGDNKRWFAYNGTEPVFLKSYYIAAAGFTGVPLDWAVRNVYAKLVRRGYNHVQLKSLPIGWTNEKPADAPGDHVSEPLWSERPTTQNLRAWNRFEQHVAWLNGQDIGVHFFMGFDPKSDGSPDAYFAQLRWSGMSSGERAAYIRYVMARLAPFANIAGWNYTWETDGAGGEAGLMDTIAQYDPWSHLGTYHDEAPAGNYYGDARYSFAGIENHGYFGNAGGAPALDSASHYQSTRDAYRDKPVYMVEGNGLWRSCWAWDRADISIIRAAWAVTLAGGSFAWQDTGGCADGPMADMFAWPSANPVANRLDVLYGVMSRDLAFQRMAPHSELLSGCWHTFDRSGSVPTSPCYALAEPGGQYVVYKEDGGTFSLDVAGGSYHATWIDTRTGARQPANGGGVDGGFAVLFTTPSTSTDWVLLLTAR
jgi:hypothetical protein